LRWCAVFFADASRWKWSDARVGWQVRTLPGHSKSVAFSPDSKRVVSGSNCGLITIWTVNGDKVCTMQHDRCAPYCNMCVYSVAFSPDAAGKWIVSGASDNLVKIWNAKTGKEVSSYVRARCECWEDGRVCERFAQGLFWNGSKMGLFWQIRTLTGHSKLVTSVAFLAGGKQVVSGSHDALVKIWDAEIEPEVRSFARECVEGVAVVGMFCGRFAQALCWDMV